MQYLKLGHAKYINYVNNVDHYMFDFCRKYKLNRSNIYKYGDMRVFLHYYTHASSPHDISHIIKYDRLDIIKYLTNNNFNIDNFIGHTITYDKKEMLRYFVSIGIRINHIKSINSIEMGNYLASLGIDIYSIHECMDVCNTNNIKHLASMSVPIESRYYIVCENIEYLYDVRLCDFGSNYYTCFRSNHDVICNIPWYRITI